MKKKIDKLLLALVAAALLSGCWGTLEKAADIELTEVQRDHIDRQVSNMTLKLQLTDKQKLQIRRALIIFSKKIQAVKQSSISSKRKIEEIKNSVRIYENTVREILTKEQNEKYFKFKSGHSRQVRENLKSSE